MSMLRVQVSQATHIMYIFVWLPFFKNCIRGEHEAIFVMFSSEVYLKKNNSSKNILFKRCTRPAHPVFTGRAKSIHNLCVTHPGEDCVHSHAIFFLFKRRRTIARTKSLHVDFWKIKDICFISVLLQNTWCDSNRLSKCLLMLKMFDLWNLSESNCVAFQCFRITKPVAMQWGGVALCESTMYWIFSKKWTDTETVLSLISEANGCRHVVIFHIALLFTV